jgi:hypothetical protein
MAFQPDQDKRSEIAELPAQMLARSGDTAEAPLADQPDLQEQSGIPEHPEQDLVPGDDDLPTYSELKAQHADQPNSRSVGQRDSSI